MIAYLDSSAVLRYLLRAEGAVTGFFSWDEAFASELLRVECRRTFHRLRLAGEIDDRLFAELIRLYEEIQGMITVVRMNGSILERAAEAFPVNLGTLDAIHLSTALLWKAERKAEKVLFTHDEALKTAAQAYALAVRAE